MAYTNPLIARWRAGEPTLGAWLTTPDPSIAEYFANCGFDEVCADQQHSTISLDSLASIFQAVSARGSVPTCRVPYNDPYLIGKSLDLGAEMVIVPMVNNRAEAERAVAAFHYPPRGIRSAGPVRSPYVMGGDERALEQAACVVMVETKDGLRNVDEIASTPGVDAVYIGPGDLALGLGQSWSASNWTPAQAKAHADAIETIRAACERHGVAPGIHVGDAAASARYIEQGFLLLTVSSDLGTIDTFARRELAIAKAATPPSRARRAR
ncbi:MAG TPA: aldolase/citrate lyase family protein [Candidatus Saccharimonadales bacterium]|nr:aldolase/citrate lyase family protein [Candidatus Saccharimonadales bacterium]